MSSAEDGAMEGVVVSAKKEGSTVTVSVISDAEGKFNFPAAKLASGQYALKIRAIGYELDGPKTVQVGSDGAPIAIKLRKTGNLAAQLTNGEWVMSVPGTPDQKAFLDRCTSCHTLERPVKSTYDADQFIPVLQRMGSCAPGTTPLEPWKRRDVRADISPERLRPRAEYLASINLSQNPQWDYALKTLPRLKGRSTRVVITEYDLPRPTAMPHDVILDSDGMAWFTDFGHQVLGKLDPKDGKVTEYQVPTLKPEFPPGLLDIELDKKGDLWVGLMLQAGVAKFDRRAETFTMYPPGVGLIITAGTSQQAMVMPGSADVDGKVWMNSAGGLAGVHRMDLASMKFETFRPYKRPSSRTPSSSSSTASRPTPRTICSSSISPSTWLGRSTPRPAGSRCSKRRRRTRIRGAAPWTRRIGSGSPNTAPTRSPCSTPRPKSSRSGRCRQRL